jgi:hypothetical protein
MRVKLAGRRFTVKFEPRLRCHGVCETSDPPGKGDNVIKLASWNRPRTMLGTAIHEAIHASRPDMSESEVLALEADIARLLWRMGYRRQCSDANRSR